MIEKYDKSLDEISKLVRWFGYEVFGEDVLASHPTILKEFMIDVTYLLYHYDQNFKKTK